MKSRLRRYEFIVRVRSAMDLRESVHLGNREKQAGGKSSKLNSRYGIRSDKISCLNTVVCIRSVMY
jgi:hypothetical protein